MPEVAVLLSTAIASEQLARIEQSGAGIALWKEVALKNVFCDSVVSLASKLCIKLVPSFEN